MGRGCAGSWLMGVEPTVLDDGRVRVTRPASRRSDGVGMGVEQQTRPSVADDAERVARRIKLDAEAERFHLGRAPRDDVALLPRQRGCRDQIPREVEHLHGSRTAAAAAVSLKARSRSSISAAGSSRPTESRSMPSSIPIAARSSRVIR